jgi:hypothetical protein
MAASPSLLFRIKPWPRNRLSMLRREAPPQ